MILFDLLIGEESCWPLNNPTVVILEPVVIDVMGSEDRVVRPMNIYPPTPFSLFK